MKKPIHISNFFKLLPLTLILNLCGMAQPIKKNGSICKYQTSQTPASLNLTMLPSSSLMKMQTFSSTSKNLPIIEYSFIYGLYSKTQDADNTSKLIIDNPSKRTYTREEINQMPY